MIIFSQTSTETNSIKNLKLTSDLVEVKEKILLLVGCFISLERSSQGLFSDIVFDNVDWNHYHQKPETWYISIKVFCNNYDILYTVEEFLKSVI